MGLYIKLFIPDSAFFETKEKVQVKKGIGTIKNKTGYRAAIAC
jgi:hypothetical protein